MTVDPARGPGVRVQGPHPPGTPTEGWKIAPEIKRMTSAGASLRRPRGTNPYKRRHP
jgi:hypothetical protein